MEVLYGKNDIKFIMDILSDSKVKKLNLLN